MLTSNCFHFIQPITNPHNKKVCTSTDDLSIEYLNNYKLKFLDVLSKCYMASYLLQTTCNEKGLEQFFVFRIIT